MKLIAVRWIETGVILRRRPGEAARLVAIGKAEYLREGDVERAVSSDREKAVSVPRPQR